MKIESIVEHQQEIPGRYTCLDKNINPPLLFKSVPAGTISLVLIFEDSDATPKPWTHWLLFNIPAATQQVAEGQVPVGATEGLANNHSFGYEGPCPRYFEGTHQYWFRLYAVNKMLPLPPASEREEVEEAMKGHIIGEATLSVRCTGH